MKPGDIAIWERFIRKNPNVFDYVEYDVNVGAGPTFDTIVNAETGGDDIALYKKKIDVVGHKDGKTTIIEIKPNAGLGAFGQVLSYEILYLEHVDPEADTETWIITDRTMADMLHLANEHGVKILTA